MKILLICALLALALCQTRVVGTTPAWNGWNGAYNGWNNWGAWPAATTTVIESPDWWEDSWGRWDPLWEGWNPSWGWNPAWGTRPTGWRYGDWNWNNWNRPAFTTTGARVVVP